MKTVLHTIILITLITNVFYCSNLFSDNSQNVQGIIFLDKNKNAKFDIDEYGISGIKLTLSTTYSKIDTETDDDGNFYFDTKDSISTDNPATIYIEEASLPFGSKTQSMKIDLNKPAHFEIPVLFETEIFDIFPKEKIKREFRVKHSTTFAERSIEGNVTSKLLKINGQTINFQAITLSLATEMITQKDPKLDLSVLLPESFKESDLAKFKFLIRNEKGKTLFTKEYTTFQKQIHLQPNLPKGAYFIQGMFIFTNGNITYTKAYRFLIGQKALWRAKAAISDSIDKRDRLTDKIAAKIFEKLENKIPNSIVVLSYGVKEDLNLGKAKETELAEQIVNSTLDLEKAVTQINLDRELITKILNHGNFLREVTLKLIEKGVDKTSLKYKFDPEFKEDKIAIHIYSINNKDKNEVEIKPYVKLNNTKIEVDGAGAFLKHFDATTTNNILNISFSDASRYVFSVDNFKQDSQQNQNIPIKNEKIIYTGINGAGETDEIEYTGTLDSNYSLETLDKNLELDESGNLKMSIKLDEGLNLYKLVLINKKNNEKLILNKIFEKESSGITVKMIVPKGFYENYTSERSEFIRIITGKNTSIDLNKTPLKLKDGKTNMRYPFKTGRNMLVFQMQNATNRDSTIFEIDIAGPIENERLFAEFHYGITAAKTTATGAAGTYRNHTMNYIPWKIAFGGKPFSIFNETSGYAPIKNIITSVYYQRGITEFSGSTPSGAATAVYARPTFYGLSIYEYFKLTTSKNDPDLEPKNSQPVKPPSYELAPILTYEKYKFNIDTNPTTRNVEYTAIKLGALFRYTLTGGNINIIVGLHYPVKFDYGEGPEIAGLNVAGKNLYEGDLKFMFKLMPHVTFGLEGGLKYLTVTYGGGSTAKDLVKNYGVFIRWDLD